MPDRIWPGSWLSVAFMNQDSVQGSDPATAPIMNPADAGLGAIEEPSARVGIPDNALTSEQFKESVAAANQRFSLIESIPGPQSLPGPVLTGRTG